MQLCEHAWHCMYTSMRVRYCLRVHAYMHTCILYMYLCWYVFEEMCVIRWILPELAEYMPIIDDCE